MRFAQRCIIYKSAVILIEAVVTAGRTKQQLCIFNEL